MPNDTAYCETCASVAMVYWNDRLNKLWGKAVYADILERAMYNGALAGVSLSGDKFFYVNPLASDGNHHRQEWFDCSCCPTQVSRFLPSVGGYVYRRSEDSLYVNLFVESEAEIDSVKVSQKTAYPWDGAVEIKLTNAASLKSVALRVPGWCKSFTLNADYRYQDGYAIIDTAGKDSLTIVYKMDMPIEKMKADARIKANENRFAIQRGPLVYAAEAVDNPGKDWHISDDAVLSSQFEKDLLGGLVTIEVNNPDGSKVKMIPYYAWDNREAGAMQVWLPQKKDWEGLYWA